MTQPCHKDTALNQQCCDSKHKDRRGERNTVPPPHFPTHDKHDNTRQKRNEGDTRGTGQCEGGQDNVKGRTQSEDRASQHTHSRPSIGPQGKRQGDANTQTGDADIRRGVSNTAALHPPCHPPSAMPPHHPRRPHPPPQRGGSRQRIPHHTNSTDTHSPPTHHTPGKEQYTT